MACFLLLIFIHWIVIYPVDSVYIQPLNNWGRPIEMVLLVDSIYAIYRVPLSDRESILALISLNSFRSIFPRPQLLMLNVWSAGQCGVLSSRTDFKLTFWDFSLAETVFDATRKQRIKKQILPNISSPLSVTDLSKPAVLKWVSRLWRTKNGDVYSYN